MSARLDLAQRLGLLDPCILCGGEGEVWVSGRMVPCVCGGVAALNHRLRERIADLESQLAGRGVAVPAPHQGAGP